MGPRLRPCGAPANGLPIRPRRTSLRLLLEPSPPCWCKLALFDFTNKLVRANKWLTSARRYRRPRLGCNCSWVPIDYLLYLINSGRDFNDLYDGATLLKTTMIIYNTA